MKAKFEGFLNVQRKFVIWYYKAVQELSQLFPCLADNLEEFTKNYIHHSRGVSYLKARNFNKFEGFKKCTFSNRVRWRQEGIEMVNKWLNFLLGRRFLDAEIKAWKSNNIINIEESFKGFKLSWTLKILDTYRLTRWYNVTLKVQVQVSHSDY